MIRRKLNQEEIGAALAGLPGWQLHENKLHKVFKFGSFAQAMGWMMSVAIYADTLDHHPEWSNVYNRVTVDLVTHDLGNVISSWDVALAQKMEEFAA
jgi:4a-hydroxytetrahydrobiopterin dehydratase